MIAWRWMEHQADLLLRAEFDVRVVDTLKAVDSRVEDFKQVLRGAAALFAASKDITREEWQDYVKGLELKKGLPAIQAVAFALSFSGDEQDALVAHVRRTGAADFRIWPPGKRERHVANIYAEPYEGLNVKALGFDMWQDGTRRAAMQQAETTGQPAVTARVTLKVDEASEPVPAVIMYLPANARTARGSQRGFVLIPIRMPVLFDEKSLLSRGGRGVALAIQDGRRADAASLLYRTAASAAGHRPLFSVSHSLDVGGRQWTLDFESQPELEAMRSWSPQVVLASGLALSLLLFLLVQAISSSRARALALANSMTRELRETEHRYRALAEESPLAIQVFAPDGTVLRVNAAWERLWQTPFAALADYNVLQDDHLEELGILPLLKRAFAGETIEFPEHEYDKARVQEVAGDPGKLWLRAYAYPVYGAAGQLLEVVVIQEDITSRRHAEQALRESERRFRDFSEASSDWFWEMDSELRFSYLSPRNAEVIGTLSQASLGRKREEVTAEDDLKTEKWQKHLATLQRRERFRNFEYLLKADQGNRWISVSGIPCFDAAGSFTGYRGTGTDITARKTAELAIEAEKKRFLDFSESTADWFWEMDADLRFSYFSDNFERNYGLNPNHALGRTRPELLARDNLNPSDIVAAHMARIGRHEPFRDFQYRIRNAAGKIGWFSISGVPVFDSGARFAGYRGTGQNITQRKEIEQELEAHRHHLEDLVSRRTRELADAKEAAEAASRAKSAFLANMSHELRTPMNHIMGMTTLAMRRATDPRQQDQLAKVETASHHLLGIINDILDLAKIEALRLTLERIDFTLGEITGNLVDILGQKAAEKGLQFRMEVPDALAGTPLQGDPLRLSQILINLAGNAIKFTGAGNVTVRSRVVVEKAADVLLRFEVEDSGIGLSAEEQSRLFRTFEQADTSMTRKYGGTGLGLAISKSLVEKMGGEIGVESEAGKGSTFWFTVRLGRGNAVIRDASPASTLSSGTQLQARHANARILVVEDEPINMLVAREMLTDVGLRSDPAVDGYEAVVLAQEFRYDLILMDMRMPVLDGLDATRSIRADSLNLNTPIVAMTANAYEEDKRICLEAGMNSHLGKPVMPEQLYEAVLRHLEGRESDDQGMQRAVGPAGADMAMTFDDAIAAHVRWKARLTRFIDGSGEERLESATIGKDNLCELGRWIYGEGSRYEVLPQYRDLVQKHAAFHSCAGEVVKLVESNDRDGATAALGDAFLARSRETVTAIMALKREATKG